jgi:aspartate racemase
MLDSAKKLVATGAELIACPDNTIHQALEFLDEPFPGKFLHIAEEVMKEANRKGYQKIALLGTKYLMEGPVYKKAATNAGVFISIPTQSDRIEINRIIFDELVHGVIKPSSSAYLLELIQQFKQQGCDAVVLGCTEIPLIVLPEASSLPTLDSTRLLAKALVHASIQQA